MNVEFDLRNAGQGIVYVKTVAVADLPDDIRAGAGDATQLYAVHDAKGEQLAVVADRRMAFVLARQNNLKPVPVH